MTRTRSQEIANEVDAPRGGTMTALTIMGPDNFSMATVEDTEEGCRVRFWRYRGQPEVRGVNVALLDPCEAGSQGVWQQTQIETIDQPFHRVVNCAHKALWGKAQQKRS